jgi:protein-ribulosamine 3-kinase
MIPKQVVNWLSDQGFGAVVSSHTIGGGCINNGLRLTTSSGKNFFLKTNSNCPPDMFACEVAGLKALKVPGGPRVPEPYFHSHKFLLMEDLAPAYPTEDYWEVFGRQMAALHNHTNQRFGFEGDNYIGSTPQKNPWTDDGYDFYANYRLIFQAELAARHSLLSRSEADAVATLSTQLPNLIPEQPASILHGDLWSGNATSDALGQPAIIDPAVYYGWAEADLAMMVLFGSPGESFWRAYSEFRPLEIGWRERFSLYNLYHLLNHLNLFGRSYHAQVMRTLRRFT